MLQQILRDMYVDPEILAELPEEQKEMLFFKIRQEQIRRYNEHEKENKIKRNHRQPNKSPKSAKKVRILEDANGKPWTWIFGEGKGEVTAEEKWRRLGEKKMEEAIKAVIQEEEENITKGKSMLESGGTIQGNVKSSIENGNRKELLRVKQKSTNKSPSSSPSTSPNVTPVLKRHLKTSPRNSPVTSPVLIRKESNKRKSSPKRDFATTPPSPGICRSRATDKHPLVIKKSQLQDNNQSISTPSQLTSGTAENRLPKVDNKTVSDSNQIQSPEASSVEKPQPKQRTKENVAVEDLYESFYPEHVQDADAVSNDEWLQQLRRFKEADERRSIRARRASKEFRRQSQLASDPEKLRAKFSKLATAKSQNKPQLPPKPKTLRMKHPATRPGKLSKPRNREEVKEWFAETQIDIFTGSQGNCAPDWFHGIISRQTAEDFLKIKNKGSFLIRVSDKIWGFALSYKDDDRVKHFLIDASEPHCYHFFGNDQIRHETLHELIEYHKEERISYNAEKLGNWVGQLDPNHKDYEELEIKGSDTRL